MPIPLLFLVYLVNWFENAIFWNSILPLYTLHDIQGLGSLFSVEGFMFPFQESLNSTVWIWVGHSPNCLNRTWSPILDTKNLNRQVSPSLQVCASVHIALMSLGNLLDYFAKSVSNRKNKVAYVDTPNFQGEVLSCWVFLGQTFKWIGFVEIVWERFDYKKS